MTKKKINFQISSNFYGYFYAPDNGAAYVHYETSDGTVFMEDIPSAVLKRFWENGDEGHLFEVLFEAESLWQEYHSASFETAQDEEYEYSKIMEVLENL